MGHPPRASIRRYAASAVYLLLGGCDADTDTADAIPQKGLIHVAHTTTGDYVDLDDILTLRANGEFAVYGQFDERPQTYALGGERLCRGGRLSYPTLPFPLCTISGGIVSGPESAEDAFEFTQFTGATHLALALVASDSFVGNVACVAGPTPTPCQGDTSHFVEEASLLASLPAAIDLRGDLDQFSVLEADGSLATYTKSATDRAPPVPDAVSLDEYGRVLDGVGGLWHYGRPVWLGENAPTTGITATSPDILAFDDGSTWFHVSIEAMWGDSSRSWVAEHRPGIRLPAGATAVTGDETQGAALVSGDLWVWANSSHAGLIDWDGFELQEPQVLGWE